MFTELALVVALGALLHFIFNSGSNFWSKYGVRTIETSLLDKALFLIGKRTAAEMDMAIYNKLDRENSPLKFWGSVELRQPIVMIKDLEIAKKILIKDFDHFVDRRRFGGGTDKSMHTINNMLFNLQGEKWKGVRTNVSPIFTTGKIRRMMEFFNNVGSEWIQHFRQEIARNGNKPTSFNVHAETTKLAVDAIANAVFGFDAGTIRNPNSHFALQVRKLNVVGPMDVIKFVFSITWPRLLEILKIPVFDEDAVQFMIKVMKDGLKARAEGKTKKSNDFIQLLLEARKGELKAEGEDDLTEFEKEAQLNEKDQVSGAKKDKYLMDDDVMVAQAIQFFFAGFATTSNNIAFNLYLLAANPDVQQKLREEVDKNLFKNGEDLDYDELNKLPYLDMVISETLRKFPPVARMDRICVKDYYDPEENLRIPKKAVVGIPVDAIHNDRKYYQYPDRFYPEHFSAEQKANRSPYAWMPFGTGPRNCIGMRFALVESKAAVAHMVHNFIIEPNSKTPLPVAGMKAAIGVQIPEDLELDFRPVK